MEPPRPSLFRRILEGVSVFDAHLHPRQDPAHPGWFSDRGRSAPDTFLPALALIAAGSDIEAAHRYGETGKENGSDRSENTTTEGNPMKTSPSSIATASILAAALTLGTAGCATVLPGTTQAGVATPTSSSAPSATPAPSSSPTPRPTASPLPVGAVVTPGTPLVPTQKAYPLPNGTKVVVDAHLPLPPAVQADANAKVVAMGLAVNKLSPWAAWDLAAQLHLATGKHIIVVTQEFGYLLLDQTTKATFWRPLGVVLPMATSAWQGTLAGAIADAKAFIARQADPSAWAYVVGSGTTPSSPPASPAPSGPSSAAI